MAQPSVPSRPPQSAAPPLGTSSNGSHADFKPAIDRPMGFNGEKTINLGSVDCIQVLNEQGELVSIDHDPNLPPAELKRVHRAMVLTRKLDQRMLNMQRQGEMGTFAPSIGQEATQIGQVYWLKKSDWFAPSYRSFGAQLWRGWPIEQLLLLWDGFFQGFRPPDGVNDLPMSIVIGSHVAPATGIAMAARAKKDPSVVVTNFGDGALSQGIVAESFNFAAVYKSPVIFVCENNGFAISVPVEKQAGITELARRGAGFGLPSLRVDGNDILAVIYAMKSAVDRARTGEGPSFIECVTYRMSYHTTADDPKVYRNEEEVERWKARCPIARFEKYLASQKIMTAQEISAVADECEQQVLAAREVFRKNAVADPREIFDFVYADLPADLQNQKDEYLARLARKGVK
ncbi:MAG TPA: pyruvate dehydrogenase (acetyl-transferring) E1 component subunit alpha [Phycisphaerales bacterium]|nr:pyruvate dehydrogenase (acetyl-transferring) E1 component subunit alpha [Phycisphaerales bacterium]